MKQALNRQFRRKQEIRILYQLVMMINHDFLFRINLFN